MVALDLAAFEGGHLLGRHRPGAAAELRTVLLEDDVEGAAGGAGPAAGHVGRGQLERRQGNEQYGLHVTSE